MAVAVALRTAASATVAGIEETALRALTKLEGVLPSPLRRRVAAIGAAMVPYPSFGTPIDPELLARLAGAIRDGERLRVRYRDHEGAATRRVVEPHRLVHSGRRWYLVAWDAGREDWRTFRVDRIERAPAGAGRHTARRPPATGERHRGLRRARRERGPRDSPGTRAAELAEGEMVCFPPGPAGAHKATNRGDSIARIVMFSSAREPAVAVYPDSDKIGVWPATPTTRSCSDARTEMSATGMASRS